MYRAKVAVESAVLFLVDDELVTGCDNIIDDLSCPEFVSDMNKACSGGIRFMMSMGFPSDPGSFLVFIAFMVSRISLPGGMLVSMGRVGGEFHRRFEMVFVATIFSFPVAESFQCGIKALVQFWGTCVRCGMCDIYQVG